MAKNKPQETRATKTRTKSVHINLPRSNDKKNMLSTNTIITAVCIVVASWFGYKGYLETRVNTPFDVQKVCLVYIFISRDID